MHYKNTYSKITRLINSIVHQPIVYNFTMTRPTEQDQLSQATVQLQQALEAARSAGISAEEVHALVDATFQPAQPPPPEITPPQPDDLEHRLAQLAPADLPDIPPKYLELYGKQMNFVAEAPDQKSINQLTPLIPHILSLVSHGYQQIGFALERTPAGFKGLLLRGDNNEGNLKITLPLLQKAGFQLAATDTQTAINHNTPIISWQSLTERVNPNRFSVILLNNPLHPQQIQLVIKSTEPSNDSEYPCPVGNMMRGIPRPLLITTSSPEAADQLRSLLEQNCKKTLHSLFALLLHPSITTQLRDPIKQIIIDGKPQFEGYYQDINGVMFIPEDEQPLVIVRPPLT